MQLGPSCLLAVANLEAPMNLDDLDGLSGLA